MSNRSSSSEIPPAIQRITELTGVEANLTRSVTTEEIERLRERILSALHITAGYVDGTETAEEYTPGKRLIEDHKPEMREAYEMQESMINQLIVAMRYLVEQREMDRLVCGDGQTGSPGIMMPIHRVRQRGHSVIIDTRNSVITDVDNEAELRVKFTKVCDGKETFDRHGFDRAITGEIRKNRKQNAAANMPILGEDDRIEIFDAKGHRVCTGTVAAASGDTVRLMLHSDLTLTQDHHIRRRSKSTSIDTYLEYLHLYAKKMGMDLQMPDRHGNAHQWTDFLDERWEMAFGSPRYGLEEDIYERSFTHQTYGGERIPWRERLGISMPERLFLGQYVEMEDCDELRNHCAAALEALDWHPDSLPKALMNDERQLAAVALGLSDYPMFCIWGPPGTGKTWVASHLVKKLHAQGKKVLVLSHSNKALDVLLAAIAKGKEGVKVHRGGSDIGSCTNKQVRPHFLRSKLPPYPRRSDFAEEKVNEERFMDECSKYDQGKRETAPMTEECTEKIVNHTAWLAAMDKYRRKERELIETLQQEDGLVCGVTLNSLIGDEIIDQLDFDTVIVDESTKARIYELLPALAKAGKQIIFIGDHKQLGNIPLEPRMRKFLEDADEQTESGEPREKRIGPAEVETFDKGTFTQLMTEKKITYVQLDINRRARPVPAALVSVAAYDGMLKMGRVDTHDPENVGSIEFIDTRNRPDRFDRHDGVSRICDLEARLVGNKIRDLFNQGTLGPEHVRIITMYDAQRKLILKKAIKGETKRRRRAMRKILSDSEVLGTVDASQGDEGTKVIEATTISSVDGSPNFLEKADGVSRGIVAISRARDELIIIGDSSTLIDKNNDPLSKDFYEKVLANVKLLGTVTELEAPKLSETHAAKHARARRKRQAERKSAK